MAAGIYKITNLATGAIYVGGSNNVQRRFSEHKSGLRNKTHENRLLQKDWNNLGSDFFKFELLEECGNTSAEIHEREQHYINFLKSHSLLGGYNLSPTAGNCTGVKMTPEVCVKLAERSRGRIKTPEEIAKRVAKILGSKRSEKTCALLRKPVLRLSLAKEVLAEYSHAAEAALEMGCPRPNIAGACNSGFVTSGYYWMYKDGDIKNLRPIGRPGKCFKIRQATISGEEVAIWENLKAAADGSGILIKGISRCCTGYLKKYNGFIWSHVVPELTTTT